MSTWALHTRLSLEEANLHLAALERAGLLGIVEERGHATVHLSRRVDGLPVGGRWERVEAQDWNESWKRGLEPVTVGAVTVAPPWLPPPAGATAGRRRPDGRLWLVIEPGQAFGTGHHETTAGCLAAIQELGVAGRRVLDVGTGTGVLAICAARLGAREVVAVDPDPLAVDAAERNAAANAAGVRIRRGSLEQVGDARFDLVLANLDSATLSALAAGLAGALDRCGELVAAGVGLARAPLVRSALAAAGLRVRVRRGREWAVLLASRRTR